ncbi:MAG TPA: VWA domain-containing protein, partial [Thermoanaerobaculia bacterium]|nr:VWA domain-containing protein [Thermoanaerobaculia bacterium]
MMRRSRVFTTFVLCAALAGTATTPLAAQTPAAQESFGEEVDVNVINVDVHVTDKNGRRVPGLRMEDFELLEDGKPVKITNFEAIERTAPAPQASPQAPSPTAPPATATGEPAEPAPTPAGEPLFLVVYVDNFNIRPAHRARALQQLRTFLERDLSADDQVMVVTYDLGLHVRQPFTTDRAAVSRALDQVTKLATYGAEIDRSRRTALETMYSIQEEALAMMAFGDKSRGQSGEDGGGGEPLDVPCPLRIADPIKGFAESSRQEVMRTVGALKLFVNSLSGLPGRKVLLHISDGITVTPGEELFQVLQELCGGGGVTSGLGAGLNAGLEGNHDAAASPVDARQYGARSYQGTQAALDAQHYSTAKEWTDLAAHANANRVTLYTLQASGAEALASSQADMAGSRDAVLRLGSVTQIETNNRRDSLNVLASDTGGRAVFNANNLLPELARIQEDFGSYYSLAFSPAHPGDGREHRIKVRVKRQDLRVRHRMSYRDKSGIERAVDRTLTALFYGTQENPLEVALEIGEARPGNGRTFNVPVRLKIPLHKLYLRDNQTALVGKVRLL